MKKIFTYNYFLLLLFFAGSFSNSFGQVLTENFSYPTGSLLTANGYVAISAAGTNPITVTTPGLSFAGSPSSNLGNAITMTTSGEDVTKDFSPTITSGNAYASFFINVSSAQATGDYFFILNEGGTFRGRIFIKSSGAGFVFGVSKNTTTIAYESSVRNFSTTYLVVLKYTFNSAANDDVVSLYVNPALGNTEPLPTIAPTSSGGLTADAVTIDRIALRQGSTTSASAQMIDGIRVGTTWASVTPVSVPTITSISPTSANVGDPGFTLIVNGTNFTNNNSTVTWNGATRTTTFVSATQLTALIPATDLTTAAMIPVGVITTGAASISNNQNFTVNASVGGTFTLITPLPSFGNVCINTSSATSSFILNGNNLNGSAITVSGPAGYTFSENASGPFNITTGLSYSGSSFSNKNIYVKFTPTAVQSYNGNLIINGGSVSNYPVTVTGTGVSNAPSISTLSATNVTATSGNILATLTSIGCTPITAYGFEYSTNSGFLNGTGTTVSSSNLNNGNFNVSLTGLAPNTRYYYKAFATNSIGTSYGLQLAFTNTALPVLMTAQPGLSFTETFIDIANWSNFFITGIGANHFSGLGATGISGIPNGTTLTASTFNFQIPNPGPPVTPSSSGGVHKGTDQSQPTQSIVLLSTGSPDNTTSAAIDFYIDFTGVNANTLSFDYAVVNNSTGDRNGSLRVYGSTDGSTFTEITNAGIVSFKNNVTFSGSKTNIQLPASFNNSPTARLRFYYYNGEGNTGSGSRPKISIDNLNITAVANTPCASPTTAATALSFNTISDVSIQGNFSASNPASDSYLIVMSTNSSLISSPINGQAYTIGDNVGDGSVISKGTTTAFTASNLTAQTRYYFFIFPMNAICTGGPLYYTTNILTASATTIAGLPTCIAPTNQPTNLTFGSSTTKSINGSFTAITADQYLVVRSSSSSLGAVPSNSTVYNVGETLGNGTVVQLSSALSFTANGLSPNTNYFIFVFGLNNQNCINGPVYNVTGPLSASKSTLPLPPCTTPSTQGKALSLTASNTSITGTFTGVSNANNYLIIKSTSSILGATPLGNTDYNAGSVFGNGTVLSNTANTTFSANGLTKNTTYYFFVFAANKTCSGGTKYATQPALTRNITTTNSGVNNYYFGTLHSHSDYSDGNKDNPGYTPAQDYEYAKTSQCMDYLGISEHNHFSGGDPGNMLSTYHLGTDQANNFTAANPNFLALYGMEWGTISSGGHIVIYGNGLDQLFGWESGNGGWGSTNNYDVFSPKGVFTGPTGIFQNVNNFTSLTNSFITLAHPSLTDFNNIAGTAYNAVADSAIVGSAIESGPAFSSNATYTDPSIFNNENYLFYFKTLLAKGYHVGPTIDHDNHNTTFGRTTRSRTAIVAPVLTKAAIVTAMRNMNFYATQDCDTKVDFTINTKSMGSTFSDRFGPNIYVSLTDITTPVSSAVIRLMFGIPGSGINAVKIDSAIGSTLSFTDNNLANMSTGYYYLDVSIGTGRIITSPIWYTRNDSISAQPVKINSFSVKKVNKSTQLDWSTEQELNSSYFSVERSADGRIWYSIGELNAAGSSTTLNNYKAFDNAPLDGINYYRIKQVDIDGKFEYSNVKSVSFYTGYNISISPNPAKDFINIFATKNQNVILNIQLLDVSGKVLKSFQSTQPVIKFSTAGIAKGLYFIKVKDENTVQTQRIIIE